MYLLLTSIALLSFSNLVISFPSSSPLRTPSRLLPRQLPSPQEGTYTFDGCNRTSERDAITPIVLDNMKPDMEIIIAEVRKGRNSDLFKLFFKSNASIEPVATLFDRIARFDTFKMPDVNYGDHVRPGEPNQEIHFMCIVDDPASFRPLDYQWWKDKQNLTGFESSNYWTTESAQVSPDIRIWPSWFNPGFTPDLPGPMSCPEQNLTAAEMDEQRVHDDTLIHTQYGSVIRALANKYLNPNTVKDNMGIQDAVGLEAEDQVVNPANYAYFASGESSSSSF